MRTKLMELDDLWEGEMVRFETPMVAFFVAKIDGQIVAYEDQCPHQNVILSQGQLQGRVLTCGAHCWSFDLCSGQGVNPRQAQLKSVPIVIHNDAIWFDSELSASYFMSRYTPNDTDERTNYE